VGGRLVLSDAPFKALRYAAVLGSCGHFGRAFKAQVAATCAPLDLGQRHAAGLGAQISDWVLLHSFRLGRHRCVPAVQQLL